MSEQSATAARVSVVMCTYNGERYLREQMDSILAQDYPLHEIIVQDDCSTDGTWAMLEAYRERHPGLFRLFRNRSNVGFNANFRTAMARATGDYVSIADQDDIWFPQKIRRQVETIGEADLCFSDYYTDARYELPLRQRVCPPNHFEHIVFYSGIPGHAMLLRKGLIDGIRHWDDCIYYDWWLSLHAQMRRGAVKVDEPLNWHRHYDGSATTRILKRGCWEPVPHPTWQPYVYGYFHRLHLQRKGNYRRLYRYLVDHVDRNRHPVAARIARLQLRRDPFSLLALCLLCAKHYERVHPKRLNGLSGRFRGFFYPLVIAYGCDLFKLEKQKAQGNG